jgi:hypothetical protein
LTDFFDKQKKGKKEGETGKEADPIEESVKGLIKQLPFGR